MCFQWRWRRLEERTANKDTMQNVFSNSVDNSDTVVMLFLTNIMDGQILKFHQNVGENLGRRNSRRTAGEGLGNQSGWQLRDAYLTTYNVFSVCSTRRESSVELCGALCPV